MIDALVARYEDLCAGVESRRDRPAVQAEIDSILRPRWVSQVLTVALTGEVPAKFSLTFATDQAARKRLEQNLFSKRILFTNRDDWPVADVVAAYRSQSEVEAGFRKLTDPHIVSFSPMHHHTDGRSLGPVRPVRFRIRSW